MNKKIQMSGLWTTQSTTRTQRRFSPYSKFHAKERSSDRRSLSIFCVKLRVIEKTSLCLCGVFRMLWELVYIKHSFWKGEHTFYLIDYELHVSDTDVFFLSPFSLFSYEKRKFNRSLDYGCSITENKFFVWKKNPCKFQHYSELPWAFWVKWLSLLDNTVILQIFGALKFR